MVDFYGTCIGKSTIHGCHSGLALKGVFLSNMFAAHVCVFHEPLHVFLLAGKTNTPLAFG